MATKLHTEEEMERYLIDELKGGSNYVARQVPIDNARLDVVGYNKSDRVFKVVECKLTSHDTDLGRLFGQIMSYSDLISRKADAFLDSVSERMDRPMRFGRWMQATECARRIHIEFYVALTEEACKDIDRLRRLKRQYPTIGIIRCKEDGRCRSYAKEAGKHNNELCKAVAQTILLSDHWIKQDAVN
jgi:hypothetical protein